MYFVTNSVEQFVFICSKEIQLLLQLFGGTLQCSGGEAMSPTLQLKRHVCCTLTSDRTQLFCITQR